MEWKNIPKDYKDYYGFVYIIINKLNNKKYIGKKTFWKKKTLKPLKGRKNKRHSIIESDWKKYTGSSVQLNNDIIKFGEENFIKEILFTCNIKWELTYKELEEQIKRRVIFRDDYYNGILNVRLPKAPKELKE